MCRVRCCVRTPTRTRETWSGLAPALPGTPILHLKPALYHAGPDVMLAVLRHATEDCVMMIGHNPGIAEFAGRLVARAPINPEFSRYPTGATLVCDFMADTWAEVGFGMATTVDFIVPREVVRIAVREIDAPYPLAVAVRACTPRVLQWPRIWRQEQLGPVGFAGC